MSRQLLMTEIEFLQKNLPLYLGYLPEGKNDWRPAPDFHTLFQLAVHLCALPSSATAILAGASNEEIMQWNQPLTEGDGAELRDLLDSGMYHLREVLKGFNDEAFLTKEVPQPWGPPATPEQHVMSLITHMHHHRGQLHNYLRQLGAPVSTETLYSVAK
jgi:uncharacterized damage-inducible protein DinB